MTSSPAPAMSLSMAGKVRQNRGRYYLDLWWRGERFSIYADVNGIPFGHSQPHAQRVLNHINYLIDHGRFDPRDYVRKDLKLLLFGNYVQAWLKRREREVEQGRLSWEYVRSARSKLTNHLIPYFGGTNIRDITEGMVEDFLAQLPERLAPKTVKNILGILGKIFSDALRRRDMARKPELPKIEITDPEIVFLLPEEQEKILDAVQCPVRRTFFLFLMDMGCRPGEARALRWEKIDWRTGTVTIAAAMDGETYRPSTKEKDVRLTPLSPRVEAALKSLPRALSGFVFTFRGRPFTYKLIHRTWGRACAAAGIQGVTLYQGTKHSKATWAVNAGIPLNLIQDFFGHKSPESTRRYAKLLRAQTLKVMHETSPRANCMQTRNGDD